MNRYIQGDLLDHLHPEDELKFLCTYQDITQSTKKLTKMSITNKFLGQARDIEDSLRQDRLIQLKGMIQKNPENFSWSNFLYLIGYYLKFELFSCFITHSKNTPKYPAIIRRKAPCNTMISWFSPEIDPSWAYQVVIQGVQAAGQDSLIPKLRIKMFKLSGFS